MNGIMSIYTQYINCCETAPKITVAAQVYLHPSADNVQGIGGGLSEDARAGATQQPLVDAQVPVLGDLSFQRLVGHEA